MLPSGKIIKGLLLLLFASSLFSQELSQAWQVYVQTSAEISELQARKNAFSQEQVSLKADVARLQKGSQWYNAWLNKIILSNHSDRQLVILDSLRIIDAELDLLDVKQSTQVHQLKNVYEQLLLSYEQEGRLPTEEPATTARVGRWLLDQTSTRIQLPDYNDLLDIEYENQELRAMVLLDIQQLLTNKIDQLESILTERLAETELAARLADFHEDLGVQMEADQDVQQRDESGESERLQGWYAMDAATEFASPGGNDKLSLASVEGIESVSLNIQGDNVQDLTLDTHSSNDTEYLKQRQAEYRALLQKIDTELKRSY